MRRLMQLLEVIRPPQPARTDYSIEQKAAMFDEARKILYDERGQLRPLSRKSALLVIAVLSAASWVAIVLVVIGVRAIVGAI